MSSPTYTPPETPLADSLLKALCEAGGAWATVQGAYFIGEQGRVELEKLLALLVENAGLEAVAADARARAAEASLNSAAAPLTQAPRRIT